jgi:2-amino-4-hydroxy-6-hydroxymethyldihydropteridine diphosphokinase
MNTVYLLLGSNQGDPIFIFNQAKSDIETLIGKILCQSSVYETEAWGVTDQPNFLNLVLKVETALDPESVLELALTIEKNLGRVRLERWKERTIDIDLLYFNDLIINTKNLTIPHPEIQNRNFTLVPLCEIAGDLQHPILLKNQFELLKNCADRLKVTLVNFDL